MALFVLELFMTKENEYDFPKCPFISIDTQSEEMSAPGFLKVARVKGNFNYPDGSSSEMITMDRVIRRSDDVVAIFAFARKNNSFTVWLRSAVRPPIMLKDYTESGLEEPAERGNMWEIPAGLVDEGEVGVDGLRRAAARELKEEVGFDIDPKEFFFLGKRSFPAPGLSGERIFYLGINVSSYERGEPSLDGSPFEMHGEVIEMPIENIIHAISDGYIIDTKTELAVHRFNKSFRV